MKKYDEYTQKGTSYTQQTGSKANWITSKLVWELPVLKHVIEGKVKETR
jgi:hypothetical protein